MKLTPEQELAKQKLNQYRKLSEVLLQVTRKKLETLPILVVQIESSFEFEYSEEMKLVMKQFQEYDLALRKQLGIETLYSGL